MGCGPILSVDVTLAADAGQNDPYTVTFCKDGRCSTVSLGPASHPVTTSSVAAKFTMASHPDGRQVISVSVGPRERAIEGEALSLVVEDASGIVILDWSAVATYSYGHICSGDCAWFGAELTAP